MPHNKRIPNNLTNIWGGKLSQRFEYWELFLQLHKWWKVSNGLDHFKGTSRGPAEAIWTILPIKGCNIGHGKFILFSETSSIFYYLKFITETSKEDQNVNM